MIIMLHLSLSEVDFGFPDMNYEGLCRDKIIASVQLSSGVESQQR